jgi:hypothetical protein
MKKQTIQHVARFVLLATLMALVLLGAAFSAPLTADAKPNNTSGNALNFDGTDDYILTGINPATMLDQTFTLEAWVNPRTASAFRGIGGDHTGTQGIVFGQYGSSSWSFGAYDTANTGLPDVTISVIPLNQWSHVAAVYVGGVSGSITVYLNGVQVGQSTWSNRSFGHLTTFYIGQAFNGADRRFDGQIDEFRVWSTARTATEIRQNMFRELGATTGLQAVYHLNESSGTNASDSSGNNRTGTLTNFTGTPWRTSGAFAGPRNALDFDGTDDYILTGLDPSTTLGQTFAIEAWVNPRSAGNYRGIGGDHGGVGGIVFGQYESGGSGWVFGAYDTTNSGLPAAAIPVIPLNQWSHVAAVYVGGVSGSITVYLNGVQAGQSTWSNRSFGHQTTFYIGQALNDVNRRFDGQIDEFRIWNTTRTAAQIRDDMAHQLVGNESGLQAYYRFDEGTASGANTGLTTLDDLTSNNRHGTLNGFALTGATSNWVASSAFNTWIGAESTNWATAGNWSRNAAPVAADNVGIYTYGAPTNAPALGSAATVNHLAVVSPLTANANLTVSGNLILDADLTASGTNAVILGSSSTVAGANDIVGTARRTSPATGSALQYNNLYTTINNANALTQMDVKLIKTAPSGLTKAVSRYYTLTPGTGTINATIQLAYQAGELNGTTEANEKLWRYDTGQSKWVLQGGTVNTTNHYVSLPGVTQFSDWAITNDGSPTAVTLSSFRADAPSFDLGAWFAQWFRK